MINNIKEMKVQLEGITCTGCAMDMETLLHEKEGIVDASVSFKDGTVHVRYDSGVLDRKNLFLTVRKLGFKAKIISES